MHACLLVCSRYYVIYPLYGNKGDPHTHIDTTAETGNQHLNGDVTAVAGDDSASGQLKAVDF